MIKQVSSPISTFNKNYNREHKSIKWKEGGGGGGGRKEVEDMLNIFIGNAPTYL